MKILPLMALCTLFLTLAVGYPALAQDSEQPGDEDGSSEQVESSDDAYRRRMELEDARRQDPSYTDPIDSYKKELEKIDKLPEESRENIRDQLVDVIVKNGEWEPSDALDEYPYEPTEAAQGDPVLMEQEQEAWEEQIEKYHEREAAAFGAYRGPVPGPGNPTGQQGGQPGGQGEQTGQQGQGSGQGSGQGQGAGQGGAGSPGTYEYQSNRSGTEDEVSTDGVSESALDFLKGRQGQGSASGQQASSGSQQGQSGGAQAPASGAPQTSSDNAPSTDGAQQSAAQWAAQQAGSEQQSSDEPSEDQQPPVSPEPEQQIRGIIAIEDLDKLEGAVTSEEDETDSDTQR